MTKTKKTFKSSSKQNVLCFADFEYTCGHPSEFKNKAHMTELLSVGIVVCDKFGNIKDSFYEVVKPRYNPTLTSMCKTLTNITQKEVDCADPAQFVLPRARKFIKKYNVELIGCFDVSDKKIIENELINIKNQADFASCSKFKNMLKNIAPIIIHNIYGTSKCTLSLQKCMAALHIDSVVTHNALLDAIDLSRVYLKSLNCSISDENITYITNLQRSREYRNFRKIRKKVEYQTELDMDELQQSIAVVCNALQYVETKEAKASFNTFLEALADDLRMLADLEVTSAYALDTNY